jgi:hypothetical protein
VTVEPPSLTGLVTVSIPLPPETPFRLGVLADTHRFSRPAPIPLAALDRLGRCDAYLHCGDFMLEQLLEPLRQRAPTYVVRGNVDTAGAGNDVPRALLLWIGDWRVGAVHDAGRNLKARLHLARQFPESLDVLCFGHSHRPLATKEGGLVFLNPGSAVDPRGLPNCSVAALTFGTHLDVHLMRLPADGVIL